MLRRRRRFTDMKEIDPKDPSATVLARDLRLEGTIQTAGDLVVAGEMVGDLEVGGRLVILTGACVRGSVRAQIARVDGTVEGPLAVSDRLEVGPSARIEGDLTAGKAAIAEGAVVLGALSIAAQPQVFTDRRGRTAGDAEQLAEQELSTPR